MMNFAKILLVVALVQFKLSSGLAETEPPFYPVVEFQTTATLPVTEEFLKIDLAHPSNRRAAEYRSIYQGAATQWLPIVNQLRFPIAVDPKSVGHQFFSIQFRDVKGKQSARMDSQFEVKTFEYLQKPVESTATGQGCIRQPYGHARFERSYSLALPKDLTFELRYVTCIEGRSGTGSCGDAAQNFNKVVWQKFDVLKPIAIVRDVVPDFTCNQLRVLLQTRNNLGFESQMSYLAP